jgi:hypothetical protein
MVPTAPRKTVTKNSFSLLGVLPLILHEAYTSECFHYSYDFHHKELCIVRVFTWFYGLLMTEMMMC